MCYDVCAHFTDLSETAHVGLHWYNINHMRNGRTDTRNPRDTGLDCNGIDLAIIFIWTLLDRKRPWLRFERSGLQKR